jgi:predicted metal-dependent peptidase
MSHKNINDEISRCIIQMLIDEPFYAHFLSGIVRQVTKEVPTAAVGFKNSNVTLYINEDFFLKELTTFSSRVAIIKHETLHLVFKHLVRFDLKKYDAKLFNIAADLVVNQFIGKWKLPASAVTLSTFPELNLAENESLEWYYKKMLALKRKMDRNKSQDNKSDTAESDTATANDPNDSFSNKSTQALEDILKNGTHSDHTKWGSSESDINLQHAESELDRIILQTKERISQKQYSSLPSSIRNLINIIIEKRNPKINWKRALKIFSSSSRRTKVKFTVKRVSKRYGTRPGLKIQRSQKIAVAVDTSGSVSYEELNMFFNEIHSMWQNGAEIEVIECDAAIQKTYSYKGKFPEFVHGRGGTAFDPVFEYLNKNRNVLYDGCIYLTDGYAAAPVIKPRCKVFWVITPEGSLGSHLKFGRALQINN